MFTGIIQLTGEVLSFRAGDGASTARLTVAVPRELVTTLKTGDSVAVNGVCLTALAIEADAKPPRFSADLALETIARTTLSRVAAGAKVNLELPTPAGSPLGGHVVQGHVDGVGTLTALEPARAGNGSDWILRVRLPGELMRYVVEKGSITIDGISLTVAGGQGEEVWIAILPHTHSSTNLHTLAAGSNVNIEVDVLAKYAESRAAGELSLQKLTVGYLLANGY
ncbi:MAG TPA: riboflavin synthase [Acidobacteriaceae bacterium]|nr:riboflavin synthase [Acidobacteriaceae bacterium]